METLKLLLSKKLFINCENEIKGYLSSKDDQYILTCLGGIVPIKIQNGEIFPSTISDCTRMDFYEANNYQLKYDQVEVKSLNSFIKEALYGFSFMKKDIDELLKIQYN